MYLWDGLAIKPDDDSSNVLIAMLDIEVDFVGDHWTFGSLRSLSEV